MFAQADREFSHDVYLTISNSFLFYLAFSINLKNSVIR